jgi:hypothetical protein
MRDSGKQANPDTTRRSVAGDACADAGFTRRAKLIARSIAVELAHDSRLPDAVRGVAGQNVALVT